MSFVVGDFVTLPLSELLPGCVESADGRPQKFVITAVEPDIRICTARNRHERRAAEAMARRK